MLPIRVGVYRDKPDKHISAMVKPMRDQMYEIKFDNCSEKLNKGLSV